MHQGQEELKVTAKFLRLGGFFHIPCSNMNRPHEEEIYLGDDHNSLLSGDLRCLLRSSLA